MAAIDRTSPAGSYAKALRYPHAIAVSDYEPAPTNRPSPGGAQPAGAVCPTCGCDRPGFSHTHHGAD